MKAGGGSRVCATARLDAPISAGRLIKHARRPPEAKTGLSHRWVACSEGRRTGIGRISILPTPTTDVGPRLIAQHQLHSVFRRGAAEPVKQHTYRRFAEETVAALLQHYLAPTGTGDRRMPGILTEGCFNKRRDSRSPTPSTEPG